MSVAKPKQADSKPPLKAVKSGEQFGRTVSLLGALRGADLVFDTGEVFSFTVTALLCAEMELDENEDMTGLQESMLLDACGLGRAALRRDNPTHDFAGLTLRDFMSHVLPGSKMHLIPDFANLEADDAGLLQDGHPFESAQS